MPSKAKQKLNLVSMMNDSIRALEMKKEKLVTLLNKTKSRLEAGEEIPEGEEDIETMTTELKKMDVQIDFCISARDEFLTQYYQADNNEKRERLENLVKGAILIGAINERDRMREAEKNKKYAMSDDNAAIEKIADDLFNQKEYQFVKRDEVESILNDVEFQIMAKADPGKIERDMLLFKDRFANMIRSVLHSMGVKPSDDFNEMMEQYRKNNSKPTVFENALNAFNKDASMKNILASIKDDVLLAKIQGFLNEVESVGKLVRKAQDDLAKGPDIFRTKNGFTDELVEREKALVDFLQKEHDLYLKSFEEGNASEEYTNYFTIITRLKDPIILRVSKDSIMNENNKVQKRLESWDVFQNVNGRRGSFVLREPGELSNMSKAGNKVERLLQYGRMRGGALQLTATEAAKAGQDIIESIGNPSMIPKGPDEEKKFYTDRIARIILHQVVDKESKKQDDMVFTMMLGGMSKTDYDKTVDALKETDAFKKIMTKLSSDGHLSDKALKLLIGDADKEYAKQIQVKKEEINREPAQRRLPG